MKKTKFTITTDVGDDKGFEEMELLEKKLHYFINGLYGTNTKVKWEGFSNVHKGTNNETSSQKQALTSLANKSCCGQDMGLSEASIVNAQIRALQKQVEGFANALESNDGILETHREALKAHKWELQHHKAAIMNLNEKLEDHLAHGTDSD